jgi:hypothetical protein
VKRKHKQYFIYYLKENIFIFDVFDYIEELAADYVDYCFEWKMVNENFVSEKTITIKAFIESYISETISNMEYKNDKINSKVFCYFKPKTQLNLWSNFFKNPNRFIKVSKSVLKNKLFNFKEIPEDLNLFQNIKGQFSGIPCLMPTGEDETFLLKMTKKLK